MRVAVTTAYYGEGMPHAAEAYRAHTPRALNRMCHNLEEVVHGMCLHAVDEVQRAENVGPRFVWYRRWQLTAGIREHMWRVLQAVLVGEEHMLAPNRSCGTGGPILVLDTEFRGATHGAVRLVRKEGVSMEMVHVRRKDMKEYQRAGLHQAEFYREQGIFEWGGHEWMMRRRRGREARAKWKRQTRRIRKEWVAQWEISKKAKRHRGEDRAAPEEALGRGERDKARPSALLCAPLELKGP